MRIITGSAKGIKLKTPKGLKVRPTGDRVKESLFSILADTVANARVADIFSGTGNLGLEALSRGAASAVFVDSASASIALIRENAGLTGLADRAEIIRADALAAIDRLAAQGRKFDLVFCDPPYNRGLAAAALTRLDAGRPLSSGAIVVIEHSRHEEVPGNLKHLALKRTERYGDTQVSFLIHSTNGG